MIKDTTEVVSFILFRQQLAEKKLQCNRFFFRQDGEHGFVAAVEEPVAAFCHQISQRSGGEFGTAVAVMLSFAMTLMRSFVVAVGVAGIGGGFAVKNGLALAALEVVSVTVLRAAGAFIHVFHGNSPYRECDVCGGGAPRDTVAPNR